MAREDGIKVLLQVGDGGGSEVFTTLAGQQSTTLSRSGAAVDVSDKDLDWTRALAGKKSAQVSATGNLNWPDTAGIRRLETVFDNKETVNCRLILNDAGDYYEGAFVVTQLDIQGDDGDGTQYSLTLQNAAALTRTPA